MLGYVMEVQYLVTGAVSIACVVSRGKSQISGACPGLFGCIKRARATWQYVEVNEFARLLESEISAGVADICQVLLALD
jgi:hypothetical protein